jgi:DinB superfamily
VEADLRYPIGKLERLGNLTDAQRRALIDAIAELPSQLAAVVAKFTPAQLDKPYRPGGWTVRQVVHHIPDSHMNGYIRFKLALTEDEPATLGYSQSLWAELPDSKAGIEPSLALLEGLHKRWVDLMRPMTALDWARTYKHPKNGIQVLGDSLELYSWHGRHHLAHITALRDREGW